MNRLAEVESPVTVTEALVELLELTAQRVGDGVRSPATLEMQEAHSRWWLHTLGPGTPLEQVDELVLDEIATRPRIPRPHERRGPGPATLRKRFSTLKAAFKLQHRRRRLARVPAFPPILAPLPPEPVILTTAEDARRLFDSLPRHRAEWFWICLWTGQRPSDVERMTWADVDLTRATMLIRSWKTGRREGLKVRIPRPLLEVLGQMWARDRPLPTAHLVRPWPSRKSTLPAHCYRCGLPRMNATALRHTCLSWIVRFVGITPAACRWAGHKSPRMMERTYAKHLPPQLDGVTEALESMAAPANDNGGEPPR